MFGEETIVYADIEQEDRRLAKAYFDCLGPYARFDLLNLTSGTRGGPTPSGPRQIGVAPASPRVSAAEETP